MNHDGLLPSRDLQPCHDGLQPLSGVRLAGGKPQIRTIGILPIVSVLLITNAGWQ